MTIKRVVFVRPGETDWNRLGRWQGQVAVPLNEHGKQQALRLANFIRPIGLNVLYSSDLRRARDTSEILAEKLGFAPVYDARLRERHMGDWQGLTREEMMSWYPDEYQRLQDQPETYQISGGESRQQVRVRIRAAFDDICARGGAETVGILSHTTAILVLLWDIVPDFDPYKVNFLNMSVTTLMRDADQATWRIVQLNDVSHLEGMPSRMVQEI